MIESIGSIMAFTAAIGNALAMICVRKMGNKVHYLVSPMGWCFFCMIIAPIVNSLINDSNPIFAEYSWYEYKMLFLISIFTFFG